MGRAAPYREGGAYVMANGAITKVKKFKDGQGSYLWPTGALPIGGMAYEDPNLALPPRPPRVCASGIGAPP